MIESADEEPVTLAGRLEDGARPVTEHDLDRVIAFLSETLGSWYELRPDGDPPSVDPSDIDIRTPTLAAQDSAEPALLNPGDELRALDTGDATDERDGVFVASATLAQVAMGRPKNVGESWDDVVRQLEIDGRPALASALWVGLATEPQARYPSIGQWRRSVEAARRSDAAAATLIDQGDTRSRTGAIAFAAGIMVLAVAAGAFLFLRDDSAAIEDAGVDVTEPEGPVTEASAENEEAATTGSTTASTSTDDTSRSDVSEAAGDACALVGPLGEITIDQVTDTAIVVAWAPSTEAVDILLDGVFVDTLPAEAFRYVIERLPLSENPLTPDTEYLVAVEPQLGEPSTACTTTSSSPVPDGESLIGVTAPTGLEVIDTSATSITVGWDPRPGADLHHLYLNGAYIRFGDVGGSSAIADETEFTFIDLEPGTSYVIGIRRVEGANQSGLVSVIATTNSG